MIKRAEKPSAYIEVIPADRSKSRSWLICLSLLLPMLQPV